MGTCNKLGPSEDGGRVIFALRPCLPKIVLGVDKLSVTMSSEATVEKLNTPATKDNPTRRNRSPQTDDEEQQDGATTCAERLKHMEEKLDKVLLMLPEFEHLKARIKKLEEEKQSMSDSLEFTQKEVKELKVQLESTTASLQDANKELAKLNELGRRQIKQKCYNR